MRHQNRGYLEEFLQNHQGLRKVLEVGSLDVNGNMRDLFKSVEYTGTDMRKGENVDLVLNGHDLLEQFEQGTFDLVFSLDTLEHDNKFWMTVSNMRSVLKPGGWLVIAVPSRYCPEHDHPGDYWRFMPQSFKEYFFKGYQNLFIKVDHAQDNDSFEDEIFGYAQKPI